MSAKPSNHTTVAPYLDVHPSGCMVSKQFYNPNMYPISGTVSWTKHIIIYIIYILYMMGYTWVDRDATPSAVAVTSLVKRRLIRNARAAWTRWDGCSCGHGYEWTNWLFLWDKKHSIDGVLLVLITGISGHNCGRTMDGLWKTVELNCQKEMWKTMDYDIKIIIIKNSPLYLEKEMKLWLLTTSKIEVHMGGSINGGTPK